MKRKIVKFLKEKTKIFIYNLRLCYGVLRTWIWIFANDIYNPNFFYCPNIKERIICDFCPHRIVEENENTVTFYCEIELKNMFLTRDRGGKM